MRIEPDGAGTGYTDEVLPKARQHGQVSYYRSRPTFAPSRFEVTVTDSLDSQSQSDDQVTANLSETLAMEKKLPESEQLFRKEWAIDMRTLGLAFPDTLTTMENLASSLAREGRAVESIALYKKALESASQMDRPD
jgi:hypothetical protein